MSEDLSTRPFRPVFDVIVNELNDTNQHLTNFCVVHTQQEIHIDRDSDIETVFCAKENKNLMSAKSYINYLFVLL